MSSKTKAVKNLPFSQSSVIFDLIIITLDVWRFWFSILWIRGLYPFQIKIAQQGDLVRILNTQGKSKYLNFGSYVWVSPSLKIGRTNIGWPQKHLPRAMSQLPHPLMRSLLLSKINDVERWQVFLKKTTKIRKLKMLLHSNDCLNPRP